MLPSQFPSPKNPKRSLSTQIDTSSGSLFFHHRARTEPLALKYSFSHAQRKIDFLKTMGYSFIGNLASIDEPPVMQWSPLCRYLFQRYNRFYQFRGSALLSQKDFKIVDEDGDCLNTSHFSQIKDEHFIYILIKENLGNPEEAAKLILYLREDVNKKGHPKVATHYYEMPGLFMVASEQDLTSEVMFKQLQTLRLFPKAAFVFVQNTLFYVNIIENKIQCKPLAFSDDIEVLKSKLKIDTLKLEEGQSFLCIHTSMDPAKFSILTSVTHFNPQHTVVGGEIYFHDNEILLINNKSGYFRPSAAMTTDLLRELGYDFVIHFSDLVERNDVVIELERRKHNYMALKGNINYEGMLPGSPIYHEAEAKDITALAKTIDCLPLRDEAKSPSFFQPAEKPLSLEGKPLSTPTLESMAVLPSDPTVTSSSVISQPVAKLPANPVNNEEELPSPCCTLF